MEHGSIAGLNVTGRNISREWIVIVIPGLWRIPSISMKVTCVFLLAILVALTLATPRDSKDARKQDQQPKQSKNGQQKRDALNFFDYDLSYGSASVAGYEDQGYYNEYDYGGGWLEYYNKDDEQQEAEQKKQQSRRRRRRAVPVVRKVQ